MELQYFLQANLYLCLFFLAYFLLLRHDTLFRRNRLYLLLAAFLSVTIPAIEIPDWGQEAAVAAVENTAVIENLETIVYNAPQQQEAWGWMDVAISLYALGVALLLLRFLIALTGIARIVFKHGLRREKGVWVVRLNEKEQPFSFFGLLFWAERPDMEEKEKEQIWAHELAHIKQWHSADIIFFEILSIFFWPNPVCWLYKQAIRGVHEFLADQAVAGPLADKTDYSTLLLGQFLSINRFYLSNHFMNKHFLKQRIMKLHQSKSGRMAMYKLLLALPVVLTALFIQACSDKILNPSEASKERVFEPVDVIDLGVWSKGKSSASQTWVFTAGIDHYRFAKHDKNPIDIEKVNWKLERVNPITNQVEGLIASSENGDALYGNRFKVLQKVDMFKFSMSTKDNSPLQGSIFSVTGVEKRLTGQAPLQDSNSITQVQKEYIPIYTFALKKTFQEETISLDGKLGSYLVEVQTRDENGFEGIKILGSKEGTAKFSNFYNNKYFGNVSYRNREEGAISIKVSRTTSVATGIVRIYFKHQEEPTKP